MFYGDELVEKVREANDIVDVVGTNVHLTKKGSNYWGLCPFHSEKTGSFSVNRNMQIFKCFGCGKAGNVYTFLMEYDNLTFTEAVKTLADRAGIPLPEAPANEEERKRRELKENILEVNREAAKYYYYMLRQKDGERAYKYLTGRALSDETIKNFGLGFAPNVSDGLYRYLKGKDYSDEVLSQTGLFTYSERGVYDKFWNRVMFPIMDKNGKVIAFGGRIMGSATDKVPKYLNSPETKAFQKGDNLFGLYLAKHSRKSYMLLCEGYMDVIALHQAGFSNAVASLGTALTPKQARLIGNYVKDVIITYDSDGAGQNAALRAIPILKEAGLNPKVLDMKPYKDPDEFIKALGSEEYEKRIAAARGAFFYETETMREKIDADNPAEKTEFDHELARKLSRITDEIERNNYIEAAAKSYNIDHASLTRLVNKYGQEEYKKQIALDTMEREKQQRKEMTKPEQGPVRSQELLISLLANEKPFFERTKGKITSEDFTDPLCNRLFITVNDLYSAGDVIVHARIVDRFEEVADQARVAGILDDSSYKENIGEDELKNALADLTARVLSDSLSERWQKAVADNDAAALMLLMNRKDEIEKLHDELRR